MVLLADLKKELASLGLPTDGRKADPEARLAAHKDAAPEPLSARDQVTVTQAQAAVDKAAKDAAEAASKETENRTKALRFQYAQLQVNSNGGDPRYASSRPKRKPVIDSDKPAVGVGEHVKVSALLDQPGMVAWGGSLLLLATPAPPN